jgi:hypothetical protein
MNLLLLLVGLRPWRAPGALGWITRLFAAVSILSVELQIATAAGVGSLYSLRIVNALLAVALLVLWKPPTPDSGERERARGTGVPLVFAVTMAIVVAALAAALPLQAADPYHLDKVAHIEATGTLAYDPSAPVKINIVGSLYEMLLADIGTFPGIGMAALRAHGLLGLLLILIAIAAARQLLPPTDDSRDRPSRSWWAWGALLLVPALFNQFVLIKNDVLVAAPALVVLAWTATRARVAPTREVAWAAWLTGLVAATKLTSLPLAVILGGSILLARPRDWRALAAVVLGGVAGAVAGGLFFGLAENVRMYGAVMPAGEQGNINLTLGHALATLGRFAISLVDMGQLTRRWWPGRGGWGGTFGVPFIWGALVLLRASSWEALARRALVTALLYFAMFALVFPDADLTHRIVLAPGLFVILVAAWVVQRTDRLKTLRLALIPVLVLSGAQVLRSAALYLTQ